MTHHLTGVGYVFSDGDPYSGVDLDNCRGRETGEIADWAKEIIRGLASYTEVSPSGTGVKIWVKGRLPEGQVRKPENSAGKSSH
jgi:primase-polymerase (primpol)-like protein